MRLSQEAIKTSENLYQQAEELVRAELGLAHWQPTPQTSVVRTFAEAQQANRFDAEYFQPKYQQVMQVLNHDRKSIKDVAALAKRQFKPQSQNVFRYIEIGTVSGNGETESEEIKAEDAPSRAQWVVKPHDVITSTVRPIHRLTTLIESDQEGDVCSSGFAVLEPQTIEPELLLVYLRLPIVCEILDIHTTASMYPAISTENLLNIPISIPASAVVRQQIVQLVRDSRKAKRDSRRLFDIAKRGVELAIEHDEAAATAWMQAQTMPAQPTIA